MKSFFTVLFIFLFTFSHAQELTDFEEIEIDSFLNGSDGSGGFDFGEFFLPNNYNAAWMAWSGWALSSMTDTLTAGFTNQYSAITGSGKNDSKNYAVSFGGSNQLKVNFDVEGIAEIFVTNSTYPFLSMRDGDSFAKKFGGADGNDPDFFLLTIKAYRADTLSSDSIDFYLADYRFEDNSKDYIIDTWEAIDLTSLGATDSLLITLSSSDVGQFGMNTPAYFCMDDVTISSYILPTRQPVYKLFEVYPNPTVDYLVVKREKPENYQLRIYDLAGRQVLQTQITTDNQHIDLSNLFSGSYILEISNELEKQSTLFMKL